MRKTIIILMMMFVMAACVRQQTESKAGQVAKEIMQQAEPKTAGGAAGPSGALVVESSSTEIVKQEEKAEQEEKQAMPEKETIPQTLKEDIKDSIQEISIAPSLKRTRMYTFLDLFAKVTGYEFQHNEDKYYVKGTRYKIILGRAVIVKDVSFGDIKKSLFYYDTVYVDRATKTAMAYCEGQTSQINKQCEQMQLFDLPYPAPYSNYNTLLPEDWLLNNLNNEPDFIEQNKYYVEGRATSFAKFNGKPDLELSIDPGTGLVIRAEQKNGNVLLEKYDYSRIVADKVRDVDVRHRSKSEIPNDEVFYR